MNTVIIPTYNEAENIAELVRRLRDVDYTDRILVVDDSLNNETAHAAQKAGCEVLKRTKKKGLSSAVIDGLRITDSEKIIVMDADLQHPPELIPRIIEELDTHDLVVASRLVEGGKDEGLKGVRKLISRITNAEPYPLVPGIKDRMTGYFGFRRHILDGRLDDLDDHGFKIGLEIMVKGRYDSFVEVPYTFGTRHAGDTKFAKFSLMKEFLTQLVKLYLYKFRFLRFTTVGASGVVVNLTALFLIEHFVLHAAFQSHWGVVVADRSYLAAFIPAFLLSVVNNYCLNALWTFADRKTSNVGFLKYLLTASITLPLDLLILWALTEFVGLWYVLSAAIAIICAFMVRYTISKNWVWRKSK